MSTNFYFRLPATPAAEDGLHIGLSGHNSRFLFQAHESLALTSLEAWKATFARGQIVSEYAEAWSLEAFLDFVETKQLQATSLRWWEQPRADMRPNDSRYVDPAGYSFDKRDFC